MAPQSRNVDVISVMTESSTGMTVSNCLREREGAKALSKGSLSTEATQCTRWGAVCVDQPFILDVGILQVDVATREDPLWVKNTTNKK